METPADLFSPCSNCRPMMSTVFQLLSKTIDDFEAKGFNEAGSSSKAKLDSEFFSALRKIIATVQPTTDSSNGIEKKPMRRTRGNLRNNINSFGQVGQVNNNKDPSLQEKDDEDEKMDDLSTGRKRRRFFQTRISTKRANEIAKANKFLRSIRINTPKGFYTLYKCITCQHQFSIKGNAQKHVQFYHLNIGQQCPTCKNVYFEEKSLQLHIPKCIKAKPAKKRKVVVSLPNRKRKMVKLALRPYAKSSVSSQTQDSPLKGSSFNPETLKVKNHVGGFSVNKAVNVKVLINRLRI